MAAIEALTQAIADEIDPKWNIKVRLSSYQAAAVYSPRQYPDNSLGAWLDSECSCVKDRMVSGGAAPRLRCQPKSAYNCVPDPQGPGWIEAHPMERHGEVLRGPLQRRLAPGPSSALCAGQGRYWSDKGESVESVGVY